MKIARFVLLGAIIVFLFVLALKLTNKIISKASGRTDFQSYSMHTDSVADVSTKTYLVAVKGEFPKIDRISDLFAGALPIVKTIPYKSSVSWLIGRPAWISDYASYFQTSTYFISRGFSRLATYDFSQIHEGDMITVFDQSRAIQFFCIIDLNLCKLGLYYWDRDHGERVFLKAYPIAVGKRAKEGRSLTPKGRFSLGEKVEIYKKGEMGYHLGRKVEMIQVYGTCWLPFAGAHRLGIQGCPLIKDKEQVDVGPVTDGCIKLCRNDIEELMAIVLSHSTEFIITNDFKTVQLPGREVAEPTR